MFDRIFLKFIAVGIVNTLTGMAIMFSLYNLAGFSYWVSSGTNYFLTSVLSFFLNKYFTFSVRSWSARMVVFFILVIAGAYFAAYGAAKPAVYYILSGYNQKIRDNIALFTGMIFFTLLNYLGQRFIVFRAGQAKAGQTKAG